MQLSSAPLYRSSGANPLFSGQARSVSFGCPITQAPSFGCEPVTGSFMAIHGGHLLIGAAAGALASLATSAIVFRDKLIGFFTQRQA
jgi:hypothetical protein